MIGGMLVLGCVIFNFGLWMYLLLGFMWMYKGFDIGVFYGLLIYVMIDGIVVFVGCIGGYGNFVKLVYGGGMVSGYGYMSWIVVLLGI